MEMIGDKFQDLIYKHDGCRIVQAIIKHGSNSQKTEVLNQIKSSFVQLMQQKYSYHLAMKAYYYAPGQELKKYFH
jgi:pumilio family protein 6